MLTLITSPTSLSALPRRTHLITRTGTATSTAIRVLTEKRVPLRVFEADVAAAARQSVRRRFAVVGVEERRLVSFQFLKRLVLDGVQHVGARHQLLPPGGT